MTTALTHCLWEGCDFSARSEEETFSHLVQTHAVDRRQICKWRPHKGRPLCNLPLRNRGNFADHVVTHFSTSLRPIRCSHCSDRLRNRQDVKRHEMKEHGAALAAAGAPVGTANPPRRSAAVRLPTSPDSDGQPGSGDLSPKYSRKRTASNAVKADSVLPSPPQAPQPPFNSFRSAVLSIMNTASAFDAPDNAAMGYTTGSSEDESGLSNDELGGALAPLPSLLPTPPLHPIGGDELLGMVGSANWFVKEFCGYGTVCAVPSSTSGPSSSASSNHCPPGSFGAGDLAPILTAVSNSSNSEDDETSASSLSPTTLVRKPTCSGLRHVAAAPVMMPRPVAPAAPVRRKESSYNAFTFTSPLDGMLPMAPFAALQAFGGPASNAPTSPTSNSCSPPATLTLDPFSTPFSNATAPPTPATSIDAPSTSAALPHSHSTVSTAAQPQKPRIRLVDSAFWSAYQKAEQAAVTPADDLIDSLARPDAKRARTGQMHPVSQVEEEAIQEFVGVPMQQQEMIATLPMSPTAVCLRGTSPIVLQNLCASVNALTTVVLPTDLSSQLSSIITSGGYVPNVLMCHVWLHLLRSMPMTTFESLFPYMFNTSVTRHMYRKCLHSSLRRGELSGRRREEALAGATDLIRLSRSICNNEDVLTMEMLDDGFRVNMLILAADLPDGEVCWEVLAVKKLLYSMFIRGLDGDFRQMGSVNGNDIHVRFEDEHMTSKNAAIRVIYTSMNAKVMPHSIDPDISHVSTYVA
ncbi:hypothetical protein HK101_009034 [Irineochytrium annulatum]|nr:hypothetical protein HK101_009034 [Irineochytrium annulatum]